MKLIHNFRKTGLFKNGLNLKPTAIDGCTLLHTGEADDNDDDDDDNEEEEEREEEEKKKDRQKERKEEEEEEEEEEEGAAEEESTEDNWVHLRLDLLCSKVTLVPTDSAKVGSLSERTR